MTTIKKITNPKNGPVHIALLPVLEKATKFTCGDVVRGTVNVDPLKRPQRVRIFFQGRSKFSNDPSQGNTSTTYRVKIPFFEYSLELFNSTSDGQSYDILSRGVNADNKVELPFEFVFPDKVELDPPKEFTKEFRDVKGFEREKGFALPPTYEFTGSSTCEQIVEYYLQAEIFTDHRLIVEKHVRQSLQFVPPGPVLPEGDTRYVQTHPMNVLCRTHRLDPTYDPNEGTLSRLKNRMKKKDPSTPSASFAILAQIPRTASKTSILKRITISLIHGERSDIIMDPPPVYLREIRVRVLPTLYVRMPTSFVGYIDGNMYDAHTSKQHLFDRRFEEPILMFDGMKIDNLGRRNMGEVQLQCSDFTSYGLVLTHRVEVHMSLLCAGEKFDILACRGPVTIVEEPVTRTVQTADGNLETVAIGVGRMGVDEAVGGAELPEYAPPAYSA